MSTPIQSSAFQAPPQHEVIKIPDIGEPGRDELKQQCFDLRIAVFTHEQGFPLETEIDEADKTATHFLLRLIPSSTPIGTIRAIHIGDTYKLSRLVVLKEYRKFGFGRRLVLALHDWVIEDARQRGVTPDSVIRCIAHSQIPAKAFYAKKKAAPSKDAFSVWYGAAFQRPLRDSPPFFLIISFIALVVPLLIVEKEWLAHKSTEEFFQYGYEPEGDEFEEDGAPHQKMVVRLKIPSESDS